MLCHVPYHSVTQTREFFTSATESISFVYKGKSFWMARGRACCYGNTTSFFCRQLRIVSSFQGGIVITQCTYFSFQIVAPNQWFSSQSNFSHMAIFHYSPFLVRILLSQLYESIFPVVKMGKGFQITFLTGKIMLGSQAMHDLTINRKDPRVATEVKTNKERGTGSYARLERVWGHLKSI